MPIKRCRSDVDSGNWAGTHRFGAAHNADCVVPCATMLDFYNGGGVDVACLGAAEVRMQL